MSILFVADSSVSRREGVRKKIVEYLQYAEIIQRKIIKQHQKLDVSCLAWRIDLYNNL